MTEQQRLFLVQARSVYAVFELLSETEDIHHCHALHYLQMATELLGKASRWKDAVPHRSHSVLVDFIRGLVSNNKARDQLGFNGQDSHWKHTIRKAIPIVSQVQNLAPSLAGDGPNPEYPWPVNAPTTAPAEYRFSVWTYLKQTPQGRQLLEMIRLLFQTAEQYM